MSTDYGRWNTDFTGDFNPEDYFGFIYRITNKVTGQLYLGKKQFFSVTRKKVEGRKNRKVIRKESAWRKYKSSSTHVADSIKEHGINSFTFEIVMLCSTTGELRYAESNLLHVTEALTKKFENGERVYMNAMIDAIKHIPKKPVPERVKEFLK